MTAYSELREKVEEASITAEALRKAVHYDPNTGIMTLRERRGVNQPGHVLGNVAAYGYHLVVLFRRRYRRSRLAWLYMTGEFPPEGTFIDHIDGDRTNDAWSNLRVATPLQNQYNRGPSRNNTSGHPGAVLDKRNGRWKSSIVFNNRTIWLGYHDTPEAAGAAYIEASRSLRGEFHRPIERLEAKDTGHG